SRAAALATTFQVSRCRKYSGRMCGRQGLPLAPWRGLPVGHDICITRQYMLTGKGWFIWQVPRCEHGSPAAIADKAVASGLSHVLIKIGDRNYAYGIDLLGRDRVAPVAQALHDRHIQ